MKQKEKIIFKQCDCGRLFKPEGERHRCRKCEPLNGYSKAFRESFYWQNYMVPRLGVAKAYKQWQAIN